MLDIYAPWTLLLMTLAVFRITRFLVWDSLMGSHLESGTKWSQRIDRWAFEANGQDKNRVIAKVVTGATCGWCLSVWVTGAVLMLVTWQPFWRWDQGTWLVGFAVAGSGALLGAMSRKWIER